MEVQNRFRSAFRVSMARGGNRNMSHPRGRNWGGLILSWVPEEMASCFPPDASSPLLCSLGAVENLYPHPLGPASGRGAPGMTHSSVLGEAGSLGSVGPQALGGEDSRAA